MNHIVNRDLVGPEDVMLLILVDFLPLLVALGVFLSFARRKADSREIAIRQL